MPTDLLAKVLHSEHEVTPGVSADPTSPSVFSYVSRLRNVLLMGTKTGYVALVGNEPYDTAPDSLPRRSEAMLAGNYAAFCNTVWAHKYEIDLANTSTVLDGSVVVGAASQLVFRHRDVSLGDWALVTTAFTGSSELHVAPMSYLRAQAFSVLTQAQNSEFEFGVDSDMVRMISALILDHGGRVVHAIREALREKQFSTTVTTELLTDIGRIRHEPSREVRLRFLTEYLGSADIQERYAAASGLAELRDPRAIADLERASQREQSQRLKRHIARIIEYLRALR